VLLRTLLNYFLEREIRQGEQQRLSQTSVMTPNECDDQRRMSQNRSSLKPIEGANRSLRRRLTLKGELALATAPTAIVLGVFALVEVLSRQRLLFASLASSAFLIYLDPQHGTNTMRTLTIGSKF